MSKAFLATEAAAVWAAKGVPFLDPLNPSAPEEDQQTMFPPASEMEIMVLLKLALMCACPLPIALRSRRRFPPLRLLLPCANV